MPLPGSIIHVVDDSDAPAPKDAYSRGRSLPHRQEKRKRLTLMDPVMPRQQSPRRAAKQAKMAIGAMPNDDADEDEDGIAFDEVVGKKKQSRRLGTGHGLANPRPRIRTKHLQPMAWKEGEKRRDTAEGGQEEDRGMAVGAIIRAEMPATPGVYPPPKPLLPSMGSGNGNTLVPGIRSWQSTSPPKHMADIALAAKPPRWCSVDEGVPADVKSLHERLANIEDGESLISATVKERFEKLQARPVKPYQVDYNPVIYRADEVWLNEEVTRVFEMSKLANILYREEHAEQSWNCEVHTPLLKLALERVAGVRSFNISSATICPEFQPRGVSGEALNRKLVDYSINLAPEPDSDLAQAIRTAMSLLPVDIQTVAPTRYVPVRNRPQAVVIETKVAASAGDPLVQLAIWAMASIQRTRDLRRVCCFPYIGEDEDVMTLPLVQVCNHDWRMYFAKESSTTLDLYGPIRLGATTNLMDIFKLVRSLRALGEWANVDYRRWFEEGLKKWA